MADRHVYVICFEDDKGLRGPVKVGVSAEPERRLRALQTASPYPLALAAAFYCPGGLAELVEQCIRDTERDRALMGEWFDIEPREAVQLVNLATRVIMRAGFHTTAEEEAAFIPHMGLDFTGKDMKARDETCH